MQNNKFFSQEITDDGSPTLKSTEKMHHWAGAASETIYIYGDAVSLAQQKLNSAEIQYLVLGLGLGYIEMMIALMTDFKFKKILSFEINHDLINNFESWCKSSSGDSIYDQVFLCLSEKMNIKYSLADFKVKMKQKLMNQDLEIVGDIFENFHLLYQNKFHVICFDAFSSQTDDHLWTDEFIGKFIDYFCSEKCIFASYAKTGVLNRKLKNKNFNLFQKKGFSGKRESTLALRL